MSYSLGNYVHRAIMLHITSSNALCRRPSSRVQRERYNRCKNNQKSNHLSHVFGESGDGMQVKTEQKKYSVYLDYIPESGFSV